MDLGPLSDRLGPLPAYGWMGIVTGGLIGWHLLHRTPVAPAAPVGALPTVLPTASGGGGTGDGGGGGGGSPQTTDLTALLAAIGAGEKGLTVSTTAGGATTTVTPPPPPVPYSNPSDVVSILQGMMANLKGLVGSIAVSLPGGASLSETVSGPLVTTPADTVPTTTPPPPPPPSGTPSPGPADTTGAPYAVSLDPTKLLGSAILNGLTNIGIVVGPHTSGTVSTMGMTGTFTNGYFGWDVNNHPGVVRPMEWVLDHAAQYMQRGLGEQDAYNLALGEQLTLLNQAGVNPSTYRLLNYQPGIVTGQASQNLLNIIRTNNWDAIGKGPQWALFQQYFQKGGGMANVQWPWG